MSTKCQCQMINLRLDFEPCAAGLFADLACVNSILSVYLSISQSALGYNCAPTKIFQICAQCTCQLLAGFYIAAGCDPSFLAPLLDLQSLSKMFTGDCLVQFCSYIGILNSERTHVLFNHFQSWPVSLTSEKSPVQKKKGFNNNKTLEKKRSQRTEVAKLQLLGFHPVNIFLLMLMKQGTSKKIKILAKFFFFFDNDLQVSPYVHLLSRYPDTCS